MGPRQEDLCQYKEDSETHKLNDYKEFKVWNDADRMQAQISRSQNPK